MEKSHTAACSGRRPARAFPGIGAALHFASPTGHAGPAAAARAWGSPRAGSRTDSGRPARRSVSTTADPLDLCHFVLARIQTLDVSHLIIDSARSRAFPARGAPVVHDL